MSKYLAVQSFGPITNDNVEQVRLAPRSGEMAVDGGKMKQKAPRFASPD